MDATDRIHPDDFTHLSFVTIDGFDYMVNTLNVAAASIRLEPATWPREARTTVASRRVHVITREHAAQICTNLHHVGYRY